VAEFTTHIPPPCDEPLRIVFADEHIVVVDKPSGLLSVPGRFVKDCVIRRLVFDYADVAIVHRLDLDTSGLLVLALNKPAARDLSRQFRERAVQKEYIAVVWGQPAAAVGTIDQPLSADPVNRPRHRVDPQGKEAVTHYEVMATSDGQSTLRLKPLTGRSHQLRVHLAHMGHPILGCDLYAHEAAFSAAPRLMLHATRLSFMHPYEKVPVTFASDPESFLLACRPQVSLFSG
jgi:tRNA pseudouridine32 synthase / 23S rRNA pseudouridine746 synthase